MKFKIISFIILALSLVATAVIIDGDSGSTQGKASSTPQSQSRSGPSQDAMKNLSF